MAPVLRRFVAVLGSITVVLAVSGSATAGTIDDQTRALRGAAFIAKQQRPNGSFPAFSPVGSTADAVLAFVAAGVGPNRIDDAVTFLRKVTKEGNVNTPGLRAKVVMAVEATGRDATSFGQHDLLGEITETELPSGRYAEATVFDQALAILAVTSHTGSVDSDAAGWLLSAQCPDGGWEFARPWRDGRDNDHCRSIAHPDNDFFRSDTNTTAYAMMALDPLSPKFAVSPITYLEMMRDDEFGGWGYTFGFRTTDANSTALVLQAYTAFGVALPAGSLDALRALQYKRCGAFAYTWAEGVRTGPDLGATIGAVPGVLLLPFPYELPVSGAPPEVPDCH